MVGTRGVEPLQAAVHADSEAFFPQASYCVSESEVEVIPGCTREPAAIGYESRNVIHVQIRKE